MAKQVKKQIRINSKITPLLARLYRWSCDKPGPANSDNHAYFLSLGHAAWCLLLQQSPVLAQLLLSALVTIYSIHQLYAHDCLVADLLNINAIGGQLRIFDLEESLLSGVLTTRARGQGHHRQIIRALMLNLLHNTAIEPDHLTAIIGLLLLGNLELNREPSATPPAANNPTAILLELKQLLGEAIGKEP